MSKPSSQSLRARFYPSFTALRAFEAAARQGSFTGAADELHLTQGAISRQIRGLEEMLGVRLFELVRRRIVLTELGRAYLVDVRRTIRSLEEATERTLAQGSGFEILELATLPTLCSRWLIPRLPRLRAELPGLLVNFSTRLEPFDFKQQPFDAAIHFGRPVWPGAVLHHLFNEKMVVVSSPDFRSLHGVQSDADLMSVPLLQQSTRPSAWAAWFEAGGLGADNTQRGARYDQFSMLSQAAMAGLGVALLPEFLIEDELRLGRLVLISARPLETDQGYFLAVPEEKTATPAIAGFRDWLLAMAA